MASWLPLVSSPVTEIVLQLGFADAIFRGRETTAGNTSAFAGYTITGYYMQQKLKLVSGHVHNSLITRRYMRLHWVACGTCYSKTEGTELRGIELQRSRQFFKVRGH